MSTSSYYEAVELLLTEAAAYVRADASRRNRGYMYPTSAMRHHLQVFQQTMREINDMASELKVLEPERFFAMLADTTKYKHMMVKGPRKGQFEERTISSSRIRSYRKTVEKQKALGRAISLDRMEEIYRSSKEYRETL